MASLDPVIAELSLQVDPASRGPRRFLATGLVDGRPVEVAIRSDMLYAPDEGREVAADLRTTFSADGLDASVLALLRARGAQTSRRELPRGPRTPTGDPAFDQRFEVTAASGTDVERLLPAELRARLAGLPELAEVRWEDGRCSIALRGAHHELEVVRAGMAAASEAVEVTQA